MKKERSYQGFMIIRKDAYVNLERSWTGKREKLQESCIKSILEDVSCQNCLLKAFS